MPSCRPSTVYEVFVTAARPDERGRFPHSRSMCCARSAMLQDTREAKANSTTRSRLRLAYVAAARWEAQSFSEERAYHARRSPVTTSSPPTSPDSPATTPAYASLDSRTPCHRADSHFVVHPIPLELVRCAVLPATIYRSRCAIPGVPAAHA